MEILEQHCKLMIKKLERELLELNWNVDDKILKRYDEAVKRGVYDSKLSSDLHSVDKMLKKWNKELI